MEMGRAVSLILSLLCAAVLTARPVLAEEAAGTEKAEVAAKKGGMISIKGEITEIDAAGNNIKVKEKENEITINVTDKTVITAGKIKRSLADLREGDKIVAKFTEEDGKKVARSIRVATVRKGGEANQPIPEKEAPKTEVP
jgi:Cu/Ag efflux protein CusF